MPVYSITTTKVLNDHTKRAIVNSFTDAHCSIMIAPEQFVHVLFADGIPLLDNKKLYVHANVRMGRSQDKIDRLCEVVKRDCSSILNIAEEDIHINLMEIKAKWVMEGGYVMPDPGEEDEWMEKVTATLQERHPENVE